jgi:hypothetical protein
VTLGPPPPQPWPPGALARAGRYPRQGRPAGRAQRASHVLPRANSGKQAHTLASGVNRRVHRGGDP